MAILYDVPAGSSAKIDGIAEVRVHGSSDENSYRIYDTGTDPDPPSPSAPVIETLSPGQSALPDCALSVSGSGFTAAAVVVFGGVEMPTTVASATALDAAITAEIAGDYDVLVRDAGGDSNTKTFTFN